jgi:hypothetical protein
VVEAALSIPPKKRKMEKKKVPTSSSRPLTRQARALGLGSPMRFLFWNIRGFGHRGRRTLLKDYLRSHQIDVVCLQKTIKQDFIDQELGSLEAGERFFWS